MYKLFLSLRYLRSRLINIIPVICMMLGVAALIVILAVMDGFQSQLRATLRGTLSDLIIRVHYPSDFDKWEQILLNVEGVRAVSPHLQSFCLVAEIPEDAPAGQAQRSAAMDGAMALGIDPVREAQVSAFREYLRWRPLGWQDIPREKWSWSTPDIDRPFEVLDPRWDHLEGVILGRALARRLNVNRPLLIRDEQGRARWRYDRVYLTTMVRTEDERKYRAEQLDFCVTGIYESGNQELDGRIVYLNRADARRFFRETSLDPAEIRVELTDYATRELPVKQELSRLRYEIYGRTRLSGEPWPSTFLPFEVKSWEDERRVFLRAIENEKGLIAIIAGMAFIVTGFMIFSILSMIVTMKTRDIGILKALGATTGGVMVIFLVIGLLVGLIGSSLGLGLGLLFVDHINDIKEFLNRTFGWEPFPADIYLFQEIPTRIVPLEVAVVAGMAIIVALIGAVVPALRAARLDPVESLRYE